MLSLARKKQGFILLIVLIFLHVFSLLSLYALKMSVMTLKTQSHLWQRENNLLQLNHILQMLEDNVLLNPTACNIPITSSAELMLQPQLWWQEHACQQHTQTEDYFYTVESLGEDACAQLAGSNNHAAYYRITVFMHSSRMPYMQSKIQSTIATASHTHLLCNQQLHTVWMGRQMWRQLS